MTTGSTNYSNVHSTDPKITSGTGSAPQVGNYMLNNEATTVAGVASTTHIDSTRQNRVNHAYKVVGEGSGNPAMSAQAPLSHSSHSSGPIPSAQVMPIHGSYRRVQTNYPQAPTAQQLEAQRRPSQPVALSHIPPYWRSPAAAPLPAGHNHNHNNNNTSNHGHGHPTTTYNQASRPPYSTSPNTQNGYTGNAPSSSKPKAPLLASRELSDQVHYSNIPKSLVSPPPQPSSSASSSSPSHHIYTGPRTTASAAAGRGRAPLPRGFKAPVAGDTSPKIEPATIGYHTPGMRQRSLSTDATASRMPYLRPIDGSRARFNISDSSLVREDGERQVVNPPDNHQYRYPGTIERPTLAPMGTVNAPSTYDSAMRDDEWPPGSFGHGPLATNSNKSSTGRSKPPPTSIPRITTVNNEPSPSTASPIGMAISNAFAQWHHSSRNSTPSPSASPSSSVVNSPVDSRASPARMLPAYPAMTGSPGTMRPSNHHAPPLPPPPPRQSGPMATFGRIMSRSKQQQQQQQQPQQPQTVPEKVETTKSTSSHTGYHEFNQNPFYFATSIGTFMKIEKPSSSSSTNKLKVNTQMASSQQGDQPRRHSDAGLTHRSQMSVESVPATVNEENEQSISPCAPSAPIERSTPWFDYNTVKHSNPNKVRAAIRQRSMGDFKAGRNARDYDKSTHGLDSSLPRLKTSTPTSIPTSSASAHTGSPHTMHPHHYPPHHFTSNGSGNNNKASPSSMRALPTSTRSGLATTNLANESPRLAGGESLHRDNNNNMLSGDVSPLLAAMPAPVPGAWTTRVPRPLSPSRDALATAATAATMTKLPTAIARPNGDISLSSSDIHNEIKSIVNQDNADKSKPTVYYGKNIAKQVKVKHANVQLQSLNVKLLPNQHLKSRAQYHMNNAETTQANHQLTTCNGEPGTQAFMRRQSTLRSVRSDESLISRITPSSSMEGASRDNMLGWSANPDNAGTQGLPMVNLNSGMFTAQTVRASSIRRTPSTSKPNSLWAKKPKHLQTVARVLSSSPEPMPGPSGNHLPGSPTKTTAMAMATATNTSSITASGMFMEQPAITKLRPWSERPSTDEISQNLDRYFPDHDLDRPIMDPVDEDEEGVSDDELNSSDPTQAEINVELFISHSRRPSETINSGCNSNAASTAHSTDNASSSSPSLMYSDPSRSGHDNQSTVTFADNMYNNEADDQMYDSLDTDSASALAARRAHYKLRRVANRKSIRVVVQEAQQRSQAAWVSPVIPVFSSPLAAAAAVVSSSSLTSDQAAQSTELNDLGHNSDESNSDTEKSPRRITPIRRRSTMLWGSRVAELPKNGSNRIRRRDRVRPRLPLALPEEMGKHTTKMLWVRGKLIGKGSFGRVFMAVNGTCGDVMAVKQVEIPQIQSKRQMEKQEQMILKLYEEIKLMKDLDHINIVQYLGFELDSRNINIFLEYVPGGSILSMVRKLGCGFPMPVTRSFTRQILCGLKYLHDSSIVHRDIKGANILVDLHGTCKISDFGVSRRREYAEAYEERQLSYQAEGSVFWMAPEVVKQRDYSAKVDIWALGCVMIEMITADIPWSGENEFSAIFNIGRGKLPPIPEDIEEDVVSFMRRCFIIDSVERPTAEALLSDPFCKDDPSYRFEDYIASPEEHSDDEDEDEEYKYEDDADTSYNNSHNYNEEPSFIEDDEHEDDNNNSNNNKEEEEEECQQ